MKTSEKILGLALETEKLCDDLGIDFNELFDHKFGKIRRKIDTLESDNKRTEVIEE